MYHSAIFVICFVLSAHVRSACGTVYPTLPPGTPIVLPTQRPLVIAHRGASGVLPEHTIRAYQQAIADGADYVECDMTLTRDLIPICLHEYWLDATTDVATHPEFANRTHNLTDTWSNLNIVNNWFSFDFSLAELKTLRKKQALSFRDPSFNGLYDIPTLVEYLDLITNSTSGVYIETKDPELLNAMPMMTGKRFEDIVLDILTRYNLTHNTDRCFLESFSETSISYLRNRTNLPAIMLIEDDVTDAQLDKWKSWGVVGIGPWVEQISRFYTDQNGYKNSISNTTNFVDRCHARGLKVHPWVIRNEDTYLPWDFQQDVRKAFDHFIALGVDGLFTDFPGTMSYHLDEMYRTPPTVQQTTPVCKNAGAGSVGLANIEQKLLLLSQLVFTFKIVSSF